MNNPLRGEFFDLKASAVFLYNPGRLADAAVLGDGAGTGRVPDNHHIPFPNAPGANDVNGFGDTMDLIQSKHKFITLPQHPL